METLAMDFCMEAMTYKGMTRMTTDGLNFPLLSS
jgi:hypothetical protein